jgi:hypothetical protein
MRCMEGVADLFATVEESYRKCFPHSVGWERAATAILLSFDSACNRSPESCDTVKYGTMHALRWGRHTPSRAIDAGDWMVDDDLHRSAEACRRRGSEFVGVFGCFMGGGCG